MSDSESILLSVRVSPILGFETLGRTWPPWTLCVYLSHRKGLNGIFFWPHLVNESRGDPLFWTLVCSTASFSWLHLLSHCCSSQNYQPQTYTALSGDAASLTPRSGTPSGHLMARPAGVESLHRWSHPDTCHRDILWTSSRILNSQIPPELSEPPKQLLFSEESCLFLPRDQRPHLRQLPHKVMLLFPKIPPPQPIRRVRSQHHVRKQSLFLQELASKGRIFSFHSSVLMELREHMGEGWSTGWMSGYTDENLSTQKHHLVSCGLVSDTDTWSWQDFLKPGHNNGWVTH